MKKSKDLMRCKRAGFGSEGNAIENQALTSELCFGLKLWVACKRVLLSYVNSNKGHGSPWKPFSLQGLSRKCPGTATERNNSSTLSGLSGSKKHLPRSLKFRSTIILSHLCGGFKQMVKCGLVL